MYAQSKRAEIAKEVLGFKDDLLVSEALVPEADPQDIWQEIRTVHRGSDCILLASHEPLMGRCLGLSARSAGSAWSISRKAPSCELIWNSSGLQPRGILRWMLVPKLAAA